MNAPTSRIAPPFPTNPSVGEWFGNWVWNGVRWVCGGSQGVRIVTTVFNASGPYMPSPGLTAVVVECVGGGGGSGGASIPAVNYISAGAGGGSGGYSRKTLPAALVAGGVNVTIGDGGPPGAVGTGPGGSGGTTSFGVLCTANGGGGGENVDGVADSGNYGAAGAGAYPATAIGDVCFPGSAGAGGSIEVGPVIITAHGGQGGWIFGGSFVNPVGLQQALPGTAGYPNSGAGASGGCVNQTTAVESVAGGPGGSGVCIVTEYCWGDAGEDDCLNPPVNVNARVAVTQVPWPGPGPCPPGWGHGGYDYEGDG